MTLRLGGDGAITGCTSLENPDLTVSGLTISGSFDAEKVLVASGTAAAPSYTFSGDTDNGLYYAGTNSIGVSTAGTSAIVVNASQNVGIGTSNPLLNLHINSATNANATIAYSENNTLKWYTRHNATTNNFEIVDIPNTSTRLAIDNSGNVGIGTNSPSGVIHIKADTDDTTLPSIVLEDSGTTATRLGSITNRTGDVHLAATASLTDIRSSIVLSDGRLITFNTGNSERMRIDSTGQLLIGETSAGGTCKIGMSYGSSTSGNYLEIGGTNRNGNGTNKVFVFRHGYWGGSQEVASIGVVTTSSTAGSGHGYGNLVFHTGESGNGDSGSTSTERMRITSGGKLTVPGVHNSTTTGGNPVYVESDGDLLRYTSSLKYKTDVETIEDARADAILNCRPVWYRSKCANDVKTEGAEKSDWGWYGFIAEEIAEIEPRLVNWATKDAVTQEDGSVQSVERNPADYEAEGVRYDNFVPLLLNLVKRQQQAIETLEAKVAALEAS